MSRRGALSWPGRILRDHKPNPVPADCARHAGFELPVIILSIPVAGSAAGMILGVLATRVLSSIVYQATPRDPLVLAGVVLAMSLLGLVATWIPAQRALSVDPLMLLREE